MVGRVAWLMISVNREIRYGIRAFDTSPYYGPSEIVLGGVLKALKGEFPRGSYKLASVAFIPSFTRDSWPYRR